MAAVTEGVESGPQLQSTAGNTHGAIDVINVHAPSGAKLLTDKKRKALLRKMLQSYSTSPPGQSIANASFAIGGDKNSCHGTATENARRVQS